MIKFTNCAIEPAKNGGAYLKLACPDRKEVQAFLAGFEYGKVYAIEPKEFFERRSLTANAYLWALLHELAQKTGIDELTLYRDSVKEVPGAACYVPPMPKADAAKLKNLWESHGLGWSAEVFDNLYPPDTVTLMCFAGSSTFDSRQMHRLLEIVISECQEQGIQTMTPDELAKLKGLEDEEA